MRANALHVRWENLRLKQGSPHASCAVHTSMVTCWPRGIAKAAPEGAAPLKVQHRFLHARVYPDFTDRTRAQWRMLRLKRSITLRWHVPSARLGHPAPTGRRRRYRVGAEHTMTISESAVKASDTDAILTLCRHAGQGTRPYARAQGGNYMGFSFLQHRMHLLKVLSRCR